MIMITIKKTLVAAACLLATSLPVHSDTFAGFKVGADYWNSDASGHFSDDLGKKIDSDFDADAQGSIWFAVEHMLPLVPNLKIRQNYLSADTSYDNADINFQGHDFSGNVSVNNSLNSTDFVLYYELLDSSLAELDVGGAYKMMDGSLRISDAGHPEEVSIDSGILMGYVSGQIGMPGLGLFAFAELLHGVNESGVHDYAAGLGWVFDSLAVDTKVRLGYRDASFDVSSFSGVTQDTQYAGWFAGIELDF
jgi:outer membrane protein